MDASRASDSIVNYALASTIDSRSDGILDSIRCMFAEKGFDGASMQDLARAAGMSVGNFYRYFPSKAAIVEAIVTRDLDEVAKDFSDVMAGPDPMAGMMAKLHGHITDDNACNAADAPLWADITAAALRKPEIAKALDRMEVEIKQHMLSVFAHVTGLSPDDTRSRFGAHAALIFMMVKATAMHPLQDGEPALSDLILRTVDGILAEVSAHAAKG